MIKINKKEISGNRIEQCRCCGEFFSKISKRPLYEIKIAPMDEMTKEMQCGGTTILLCKNCIKELKNELELTMEVE